ncbi:hypothetical protein GEMRC1_005776 [Eukaryota sp. GEM-RC1]
MEQLTLEGSAFPEEKAKIERRHRYQQLSSKAPVSTPIKANTKAPPSPNRISHELSQTKSVAVHSRSPSHFSNRSQTPPRPSSSLAETRSFVTSLPSLQQLRTPQLPPELEPKADSPPPELQGYRTKDLFSKFPERTAALKEERLRDIVTSRGRIENVLRGPGSEEQFRKKQEKKDDQTALFLGSKSIYLGLTAFQNSLYGPNHQTTGDKSKLIDQDIEDSIINQRQIDFDRLTRDQDIDSKVEEFTSSRFIRKSHSLYNKPESYNPLITSYSHIPSVPPQAEFSHRRSSMGLTRAPITLDVQGRPAEDSIGLIRGPLSTEISRYQTVKQEDIDDVKESDKNEMSRDVSTNSLENQLLPQPKQFRKEGHLFLSPYATVMGVNQSIDSDCFSLLPGPRQLSTTWVDIVARPVTAPSQMEQGGGKGGKKDGKKGGKAPAPAKKGGKTQKAAAPMMQSIKLKGLITPRPGFVSKNDLSQTELPKTPDLVELVSTQRKSLKSAGGSKPSAKPSAGKKNDKKKAPPVEEEPEEDSFDVTAFIKSALPALPTRPPPSSQVNTKTMKVIDKINDLNRSSPIAQRSLERVLLFPEDRSYSECLVSLPSPGSRLMSAGVKKKEKKGKGKGKGKGRKRRSRLYKVFGNTVILLCLYHCTILKLMDFLSSFQFH